MKTLTAIAGLTLLTAVSFAQSSKIDAYTKDALLAGLDDERHAEALYKTAITVFGNRTPFKNLVAAEVQHQNAFLKLMKTYGVPVPPNPYLGQTLTIPSVFSEACLEFAQFERLEAAKLREMAAKVNVKNVANVFLQLAKVSEENHAAALEKAAANNCGGTGVCDGAGPKGKGNGRGKASLAGVQNCAMPLQQGNRTGICDGTGPKGNGHGYGKGNCDGTGPHGKGPGYRKGQGNGKGQGQGKGQGRGNGQGQGQGRGR